MDALLARLKLSPDDGACCREMDRMAERGSSRAVSRGDHASPLRLASDAEIHPIEGVARRTHADLLGLL
jgi:hypothetical protein